MKSVRLHRIAANPQDARRGGAPACDGSNGAD
jgi:hypothetical protein